VFAVAGGLAALLMLLGGWRVTRHAGVSCAVPSERLAAAWSGRDDARRQSIHRAFLASGRPTAETSWQRVSAALDEHVGKWSGMYLESCEATHVRGEQSAEVLDLRTSCLNESLDEVRALTDVLVTADAAAIARSSTVVRDLTPVSRCADLDVLRSAVPLPRDPTTLGAVQRLKGILRTVRAQAEIGNRREAAKAAEALRLQAQTLAYKPLLAEVLQVIGEGQVEYEPAKAERSLEEAFLIAETAGDGETAVRAASSLTFVTGYHHAGRREEAKRWARIAEAILDGLKGNQNRLRGWVTNDLASLMAIEGNCDEASALYRRAIALKQEALGNDHRDVGISLNGLCQVLSCAGEFHAALEAGNRAVEIVGKTPDLEASIAGNAYTNRGLAFARLGQYRAAAADFARALEIYRSDPETLPRSLAEPLHGLGEVRLMQREVATAIPYLKRALEIREVDEVDPTLVADTRFALARALWLDGGDRRRARALAVAARDGYASRQRPEVADVAAWLAAHSPGRR
jgi:eukaryotic-like serine/threonine-protein kinase